MSTSILIPFIDGFIQPNLPHHVLFLHLDLHFRAISDFLDLTLFDKIRPEHHTSQLLTGSRWDRVRSGWQVGGCAPLVLLYLLTLPMCPPPSSRFLPGFPQDGSKKVSSSL